MKRGTPDHPKAAALAQALGCHWLTAVGLLEVLWHFTAKYSPRGDIGKWSDEHIAAALKWDGEAAALVRALVSERWLDDHAKYRLVVHDWHEHADETTKKYLARNGLTFASLDRPLSRHVRKKSGHVETISGNVAPAYTNTRANAVAVAGAIAKPLPEPEPGQANDTPPEPALPADAGPVVAVDPSTNGSGHPKRPDAVAEVFGHWQEAMGKRRAVLDEKRRNCIRARLREGHSVDDLRKAVDGYRASPWHRGANERRQVYDSLTLILRDAEHVERGMALADEHGPPGRGSPGVKHGLPVAGPWERADG